MKKVIYMAYAICAIVIFILAGYMFCTFELDMTDVRGDEGYQILTQYQSTWETDESLPCAGKDVIRISLEEVPVANSCLAFYTIHQDVVVFVGDELVYQVQPSEQNLFGRTPGNFWSSVAIYPEDIGKEIRIELIPAYESSIGTLPDIYMGSKFNIYSSLIWKNMPAVILAILAIVIGIIFCIYAGYNIRTADMDRNILMLGIFSVMIGLWKLSDSEAISLLFPHRLAISYYPLFALMLVVVPYTMFVKQLFHKKDSMVWNIVCLTSITVTLIELLCQLAGFADFRETLLATQLSMVGLAVAAIGKMVIELRTNGWNTWLKVTAVCMLACLVGMVLDVGMFYISSGKSMLILGMLGFLSYIIILGAMYMKENKRLLAIASKAKHLEKMAYHDQLTGLYNRAAYVEYIGDTEFRPEEYIVVMCDLNNLKECNDTMGHEAGDRYLMASAGVIRRTFQNIGNCYRMGGDEFCVLLHGVTLEECKKRIAELKEQMEAYNKEHPDEFAVQIACGYKQYDAEIDYDIGDTLRRADKMMYHEKLTMKQERIVMC